MDDCQSLHRKWLFHQTSIFKWLFGVPGQDVEMQPWSWHPRSLALRPKRDFFSTRSFFPKHPFSGLNSLFVLGSVSQLAIVKQWCLEGCSFSFWDGTPPPIIMVQSKMGVSPIGSLPFKYSNFTLNHDYGIKSSFSRTMWNICGAYLKKVSTTSWPIPHSFWLWRDSRRQDFLIICFPKVWFGISPTWWQLKYFLCSPLFGEMIHFDEHIFQMGWFNHQLVPYFREIQVGEIWWVLIYIYIIQAPKVS